MIIYGTRAKQVHSEAIPATCPNCNTPHSVEMGVLQRYVHIFWIPMFPINKMVATHCSHCNQVLTSDAMPKSWKDHSKEVKKRAKAPFWMFIGLILLGFAIFMGIRSDREKRDRNAQRIAMPQKGDVYSKKTTEGQYTIMRVKEVENDSVLIQPSLYETNQLKGIGEITAKGEGAYDTLFMLKMPKSELKNMFETGVILDVH